jgi:TonB family protein
MRDLPSGTCRSGVSLAQRLPLAGALLSAVLAFPALSAQTPAQTPSPAPDPAPAQAQQPATAPAQPAAAPAAATPAAPAQTATPAAGQPQSAPAQAAPTQAAPAQAAPPASRAQDEPSITEEELKQRFLGKTFYLRGGYLENSLHFAVDGRLDGTSQKASYTLDLVEIESVHLDKQRLQLVGVRYGVHFLGALASEDQSAASEKVKISTKKNPLKIEIDREEVDTSFEKKEAKQEAKDEKMREKGATPAQPSSTPNPIPNPVPSPAPNPAQQSQTEAAAGPQAPAQPASVAPAMKPQPAAETNRHGVPVTTSMAHANKTLRDAFDRIFAPSLDDRMMAALPGYWQLYYKAVAAQSDYRPSDASILRQSQVDQKARLLHALDPPSNEYAQANGIVGLAMYHIVVGADGKASEVVIGRPIGFGLDESAVDAIQKASFQPAMRQGQPVPVLLDMTVQFRIYSKLTAAPQGKTDAAAAPQSPVLPGPYSANQKAPQ